MAHVLRHRLFGFCAALLLALASVVSAQHMAPDRDQMVRAAVLTAMGADLSDLCGEDGAGHDHDCPFCHKLPKPPRLTAPDGFVRSVVAMVDPVAGDLVLGPRLYASHVSARAPPVAA